MVAVIFEGSILRKTKMAVLIKPVNEKELAPILPLQRVLEILGGENARCE